MSTPSQAATHTGPPTPLKPTSSPSGSLNNHSPIAAPSPIQASPPQLLMLNSESFGDDDPNFDAEDEAEDQRREALAIPMKCSRTSPTTMTSPPTSDIRRLHLNPPAATTSNLHFHPVLSNSHPHQLGGSPNTRLMTTASASKHFVHGSTSTDSATPPKANLSSRLLQKHSANQELDPIDLLHQATKNLVHNHFDDPHPSGLTPTSPISSNNSSGSNSSSSSISQSIPFSLSSMILHDLQRASSQNAQSDHPSSKPISFEKQSVPQSSFSFSSSQSNVITRPRPSSATNSALSSSLSSSLLRTNSSANNLKSVAESYPESNMSPMPPTPNPDSQFTSPSTSPFIDFYTYSTDISAPLTPQLNSASVPASPNHSALHSPFSTSVPSLSLPPTRPTSTSLTTPPQSYAELKSQTANHFRLAYKTFTACASLSNQVRGLYSRVDNGLHQITTVLEAQKKAMSRFQASKSKVLELMNTTLDRSQKTMQLKKLEVLQEMSCVQQMLYDLEEEIFRENLVRCKEKEAYLKEKSEELSEQIKICASIIDRYNQDPRAAFEEARKIMPTSGSTPSSLVSHQLSAQKSSRPSGFQSFLGIFSSKKSPTSSRPVDPLFDLLESHLTVFSDPKLLSILNSSDKDIVNSSIFDKEKKLDSQAPSGDSTFKLLTMKQDELKARLNTLKHNYLVASKVTENEEKTPRHVRLHATFSDFCQHLLEAGINSLSFNPFGSNFNPSNKIKGTPLRGDLPSILFLLATSAPTSLPNSPLLADLELKMFSLLLDNRTREGKEIERFTMRAEKVLREISRLRSAQSTALTNSTSPDANKPPKKIHRRRSIIANSSTAADQPSALTGVFHLTLRSLYLLLLDSLLLILDMLERRCIQLIYLCNHQLTNISPINGFLSSVGLDDIIVYMLTNANQINFDFSSYLRLYNSHHPGNRRSSFSQSIKPPICFSHPHPYFRLLLRSIIQRIVFSKIWKVLAETCEWEKSELGDWKLGVQNHIKVQARENVRRQSATAVLPPASSDLAQTVTTIDESEHESESDEDEDDDDDDGFSDPDSDQKSRFLDFDKNPTLSAMAAAHSDSISSVPMMSYSLGSDALLNDDDDPPPTLPPPLQTSTSDTLSVESFLSPASTRKMERRASRRASILSISKNVLNFDFTMRGFESRLQEQFKWISRLAPESTGVPLKYFGRSKFGTLTFAHFRAIIDLFDDLGQMNCPLGMLSQLSRIGKALVDACANQLRENFIAEYGPSATVPPPAIGADDFLPLFIFCLSRSCVSNWFLRVQLLKKFAHIDRISDIFEVLSVQPSPKASGHFLTHPSSQSPSLDLHRDEATSIGFGTNLEFENSQGETLTLPFSEVNDLFKHFGEVYNPAVAQEILGLTGSCLIVPSSKFPSTHISTVVDRNSVLTLSSSYDTDEFLLKPCFGFDITTSSNRANSSSNSPPSSSPILEFSIPANSPLSHMALLFKVDDYLEAYDSKLQSYLYEHLSEASDTQEAQLLNGGLTADTFDMSSPISEAKYYLTTLEAALSYLISADPSSFSSNFTVSPLKPTTLRSPPRSPDIASGTTLPLTAPSFDARAPSEPVSAPHPTASAAEELPSTVTMKPDVLSSSKQPVMLSPPSAGRYRRQSFLTTLNSNNL